MTLETLLPQPAKKRPKVNFLAFRLTCVEAKVKEFADAIFPIPKGAPMKLSELSRRERQIMEVIYAKGEATATDVLENLSDAPTRTSVRTFLRILEEKGHLKHTKRGREFVYQPVRGRERAGKSAFQRVLETFFDGSLEKAVASHLADTGSDISGEELRRLAALIAEAKRKDHSR